MSRRLLFIGLIVLSLGSFAQQNDFQIWSELSAETELKKDFSLFVVEELRFNQNASHFDELHNSIGAKYNFNKHFRMQVLYRYSLINTLKKGIQNANRFGINVSYKEKFKRFRFQYRLRYQIDYINLQGLKIDGHTLRNRFTLKYNIRKTPLMPFVNYELYYKLQNVVGNGFGKHRFTGGFDYGFTDYFSASIYYRYQISRGYLIDARNTYILGLSAEFKF